MPWPLFCVAVPSHYRWVGSGDGACVPDGEPAEASYRAPEEGCGLGPRSPIRADTPARPLSSQREWRNDCCAAAGGGGRIGTKWQPIKHVYFPRLYTQSNTRPCGSGGGAPEGGHIFRRNLTKVRPDPPTPSSDGPLVGPDRWGRPGRAFSTFGGRCRETEKGSFKWEGF